MKTFITAAVLSFASQVATADNFAPWEQRGIEQDSVQTSHAEVAPFGFAPWRDTQRLPQMSDSSTPIAAQDFSAFRPWS